jgi:hypothetical protein
MARFQLAELSRDTRLAAPLSLLLKDMPVVVLDHGQNDLQGQPWHKTAVAYDEWIHLTNEELIREFIYQLCKGPIQAAAISLRKDAEAFGATLHAALASLPSGAPRRWADFPERLNSWIRARCELNGVAANEEALGHPDCYVGLRLAYGVLFSRYYIGRKSWVSSDYIDYLQTSDIAYAGIVVTERNLGECIRQLSKRSEVTTPEFVADLSWLAHPTNAPRR